MFNWKTFLLFAAIAAAIGVGSFYMTKNKWVHAAVYAAVGAGAAWGAVYLPAKFPALSTTPSAPIAPPPA
jgi:hypothetical protein